MGERFPHEEEVAGSNPAAPTRGECPFLFLEVISLDRLDFAIKVSKRVGKLLLSEWGNPEKLATKSNFQDLITDMDEKAQKIIVDSIRKNFPEDGILSEEGIDERAESYWVIDPIDGTVNYAFGLPSFSVSIAYVKGDEVELGVVHVPTLDETYYAKFGEGAYMNGERIRVSSRGNLKECIGLLGFFRGFTSKVLELFEDKVVRMRILGSLAVAIVYVAHGRADFAIAKRANVWDVAAANLILKEAGGTITDMSGNPILLESNNGYVFSNGKVHQDVLKNLEKIL